MPDENREGKPQGNLNPPKDSPWQDLPMPSNGGDRARKTIGQVLITLLEAHYGRLAWLVAQFGAIGMLIWLVAYDTMVTTPEMLSIVRNSQVSFERELREERLRNMDAFREARLRNIEEVREERTLFREGLKFIEIEVEASQKEAEEQRTYIARQQMELMAELQRLQNKVSEQQELIIFQQAELSELVQLIDTAMRQPRKPQPPTKPSSSKPVDKPTDKQEDKTP